MSVLKYKAPKGVVTNIDSSDAPLEIAAELMNMKAENTYLEGKVIPWGSDQDMPNNVGGYTLESAIHGYVSIDQYSNNVQPVTLVKVKLLVYLITGLTYSRKIFYKADGDQDWTDIEDLCTDWPVTEDAGFGTSAFTETYLTTDIQGDSFLINEDGVIRIYLPNDSFWFGRLDRSIDVNNITGKLEVPDGYYFERLVEDVDLTLGANSYSFEYRKMVGVKTRLGIAAKFEENPEFATSVGPPVTFNDVTPAENKPLNLPTYENYWAQSISYELLDASNLLLSNVMYHAAYGGGSQWWIFRPGYSIGGSSESEVYTSLDIKNFLTPFGGWDIHSRVLDTDDLYIKDQDGDVKDLKGFENAAQVLAIDDDIFTGGSAVTWEFTGSSELDAASGWSAGTIHFMITCLLDYKTEIMLQRYSFSPTKGRTETYYSVGVTLDLPDNVNKRITNIKLYAKELLTDETIIDYEEVKSFDLQAPTDKNTPFYRVFSVRKEDQNGRFLYNATNFYIEDEHLERYKILNKLEDRAISRGYSVCLSQEYRVTPFHCAIGNGQIMTDLFYSNTPIVTAFDGVIIALESIEGKIFAITDKATYLIHVAQIGGYPAFDVIQQLEYGIKYKNDAISIQGAIVIFSVDGIFLTDGQDRHLLSEAINDIVEEDYELRSNSRAPIFYNKKKHELYYFPENYIPVDYTAASSEYGFVYSFKRKQWETVNIDVNYINAYYAVDAPTFLQWTEIGHDYFKNLTNFTEDWDGNTCVIRPEGIVKENGTDGVVTPAVGIKSHVIDLDEMSIQKILTEVYIDYEVLTDAGPALDFIMVGQGLSYRSLENDAIFFEGDKTKIHFGAGDTDNPFPVIANKKIRVRLPVPIDKRKQFTSLRFIFASSKPEVILYGIEFHFDPIKGDNINYE